MFDTINLWLPFDNIDSSSIKAIPYNLINVSETQKKDTGEISINGNIGSFRVSIYSTGISLKGSLPKYFLGDNMQTLSRGDSQRAFEKLSDSLGLPISKSIIRRIDVAQNLIVKHPFDAYLSFLGYSRNYQRKELNNGLYYTNSKRVKLFYGKIHEQQRKGVVIPEIYRGKNLLRYELRYVSRLPLTFNRSEVTGYDLYDQKFYVELAERWQKEYNNISKGNNFNVNLEYMKNQKDFEDIIFIAGFKSLFGSESKALEAVEVAKKQGVFGNKMQVARLKKKIRELSHLEVVKKEPEIIKELDFKIKEVIKFYR